MESVSLRITTGRQWAVDLTEEVGRACRDRRDGLCHLFLPHATAGLALIELGSGSEEDLRDAAARLLPRDSRYRHSHGSAGHGADHVLPAFIAPFLVLAVENGAPVLGTWQRIVLIDPNVDNPERTLLLHFLSDGSETPG